MEIRDEILIEMSYVQKSKYRTKVMKSIGEGVKIPSVISKDSGIKTNHISKVLKELKKHELVECINPEAKKGRLYRLTDKGKEVVKNLNGYEEAPSALNVKRSVDKKRKNFEQLLEIAHDLYNQKKYKEADKCLNKALKFKKKLYYIFYLKGKTFINRNNYKKAINCFDKSLESDPRYVPSLNGKGNALMHLNRFVDAISCFDEVLSLNPEDSNVLKDSWIGKIESLIKLEKYEKAFFCCYKIVELHQQGYSRILREIGRLFRDAGICSEAVKYFEKAIELDPNDAILLNNLAKIYLNMLKTYDKLHKISLQEALKYSNKARSIDSDNFDILFTAAKIQFELKNYGKAREYASEAKKLNPSDSDIRAFIHRVEESKKKARLDKIRKPIR